MSLRTRCLTPSNPLGKRQTETTIPPEVETLVQSVRGLFVYGMSCLGEGGRRGRERWNVWGEIEKGGKSWGVEEGIIVMCCLPGLVCPFCIV